MNKIIEAEELKIELKETQQALYEALNRIDKALHKLNSSKNHFKTQRENNAVNFTIKILKGE